jgi:hypothetical protein
MKINRSTGLSCLAVLALLGGCGKKDDAAQADAASTSAATETASSNAASAPGSWTPEALEELLAPIAIYPDVVLGHVLSAATNPQEVLDAGNWLIEHQDLSGEQVDEEAKKLGLSVSTRALLQFPEVVDMMCMQMDWTTELGQAFTADQAAVLDAVQRLRTQARDVGNLESSAQLKVETESQDGKEIVTIAPPNPEVVYVPKYDPQAVYAPPPAVIPPPSTINVTPAPGTTTTVTTAGGTTTVASSGTATSEEKGHSTGALVTTGLLAFGAGILVNEVFDDDDDWDHYGPNYYHGGMYYGGGPYYPPPPYMYRPPYGGGYYPAHGYNRPANYQRGFNNNTIIVNDGGNDYWNRNRNQSPSARTRPAQSPITAANPKRSDLNDLNRRSGERRSVAATQPATREAARDRSGGGYAGARPENQAARERMVAKSPPPGVARDLPQRPKTEYKGAANRPATTDRASSGNRPAAASRPAAAREPAQARTSGTSDRGRADAAARGPIEGPSAGPATRPAAERPAAGARDGAQRTADRTAFGSGGAQSGRAERQASARGRGSMGGGGKSKPRKPKR